jgi:hypothetical protein
MHVQVVSFSQDYSFEDKSTTIFVIFRLATGAEFRAVVTEDTMKLLLEVMAQEEVGVAPPQRLEPPAAPEGPALESEGAIIFGGEPAGNAWLPPQGEEQVVPPEKRETPPIEEPPQPVWTDPSAQARSYKRKKSVNQVPKSPTMGKTVPKDDLGYPLVSSSGGVDPGEISSGGEGEDDGIGQL